MAPAQSKLADRKAKAKKGAPFEPLQTVAVSDLKPPPAASDAADPVSDTKRAAKSVSDKKRVASRDLLADSDDELSAPVNEVVLQSKSPAVASPTTSNSNDPSGRDAGSALTNSSASTAVKADKYAELRNTLKRHKTPRSAKKQRRQKRALPKPGNGKYNKIYTSVTADGSVVMFVMHKKRANEFGFTRNIDDVLNANPNIKEVMGIDNIFLRVDQDNGNVPYSVDYLNKDGEARTKFASIYHRKPTTESTKANREKWARRVLVKYFNKYGSARYSQKNWGAEVFEYGGDLATSEWTDYLSDYITNADVAKVMKEDLGFGEEPLTCEEMAANTMLVEMYYGPNKIEEGKEALLLLGKGKTFNTGESDAESASNPYETDDDGERVANDDNAHNSP